MTKLLAEKTISVTNVGSEYKSDIKPIKKLRVAINKIKII